MKEMVRGGNEGRVIEEGECGVPWREKQVVEEKTKECEEDH